eukprot:CAMPEP_0197321070 /NCGR_PEP_ID=MMETSP0891-20130614/63113_1 /TAXON_ID=44058 ORGANISM="Aureoumbra lagunensis, Strain CCMP1510" /NCGR_SAMPLE_ID=MMETSP0891 /ASSEMBLY_ACC=CAM_ASM_000534 /LENGTH=79 /DNA_ID=CAMNT_0042812743 /DNA_START=56 /DNA_END=292 /DNA_ORIENTATION=-
MKFEEEEDNTKKNAQIIQLIRIRAKRTELVSQLRDTFGDAQDAQEVSKQLSEWYSVAKNLEQILIKQTSNSGTRKKRKK